MPMGNRSMSVEYMRQFIHDFPTLTIYDFFAALAIVNHQR